MFRHSEPQPLRKMCTFYDGDRQRQVGSDDTPLATLDGMFLASAGYPIQG